MQSKIKGVSKEKINENWINNCVDRVQLATAIDILSKDPSSQGLQRKAMERNTLITRGPSEDDKKKAENHRIQGNDCVKKEDYASALEQYTKSIQLNPTEPSSYGNRALIYIKTKDFKNALDDANRAITLNRTFLRGYQRRAEAFLGLKDYKNAYITLIAILKEEPSHTIVFILKFNKN